MSLNRQHLDYLLQQYITDEARPEEIEELFGWIRRSEQDEPLRDTMQMLWRQYRPEEQLPAADWEGMYARIMTGPVRREMPAPRRRWQTLAVAAGIGGLLVLGIGWWVLTRSGRETAAAPANIAAVAYTRHITLPDGSTVVLHAGSRLDYPMEFAGKTREVSLSGEAYFDIMHRSMQPFIIHTGRVKTTVLGTAFNITAYPDSAEIKVSVTRGRVRVENEQQVLAELEPNQQVVYNQRETQVRREVLNASQLVTNWTKKDMVFASIPFEQIAAVLQQRYGVPIHFKNEALKHCPIRASFAGTEPLKDVMTVLCEVRNASYTITPQEGVVIDGEGCDSNQ
jgi:ferric-dicitrate binding protein FerR (iron transport regulator)